MIHDIAIASASAAITAAVGVLSLPVSALLNRYLNRYRPHVQLGSKVLRLLDQGLIEGDSKLRTGFYNAAVQYAAQLSEGQAEPHEIEAAALWAIDHFKARVFDQRARAALVEEI